VDSLLSYLDGGSQLVVDIVSAVFDGYGAAAFSAGNHGNGLAAVAAQGEEEGIQFLIVGIDPPDNIFFSLFGIY
jgi:hypothetical protein